MPDLESVSKHVEHSLQELLKAARKQSAKTARANGSKKSGPKRPRKATSAKQKS